MSKWFFGFVMFGSLFISSPARTAVIINVAQSGPDVVASGSGTLDLASLSIFITAGPLSGDLLPNGPILVLGPPTFSPASEYQFVSSRLPGLGPGGAEVLPTFGSGQKFGVLGSSLWVPSGYISGLPLAGASTYAGYNITSLGLTPGVYTTTWGSGATADFLTVNIVPEPRTLTSLAIGIAGMAGAGWFGRRQVPNKVPA